MIFWEGPPYIAELMLMEILFWHGMTRARLNWKFKYQEKNYFVCCLKMNVFRKIKKHFSDIRYINFNLFLTTGLDVILCKPRSTKLLWMIGPWYCSVLVPNLLRPVEDSDTLSFWTPGLPERVLCNHPCLSVVRPSVCL